LINNGKIPDYFHLKGGQVFSFKYDKINYVCNDDIDVIKKLCENMNKPYTGQGVGTCILNIWKEVSGFDKIPKSSHNPFVIDTLLNAKSNRSHYGFMNNTQYNIDNSCKAYDIVKCYRACMYQPTEEWIRLDFNDEWEPYDGKLKNALYYVKTEDELLFKKSNVYSSCIIKEAFKENIQFEILYQLVPSHYEKKTLFVDFINKVIEYSNGDESIAKLLINMMSGLLGQSHREAVKCKINKDKDQIFNWLHRYTDLGKGIFIKQIPNTDRFLYGIKKDYIMNETNLPMYIQVLDESNVKLYRMGKAIGGELIARKVDCVIVRGGREYKKNDVLNWGDYRPCELPVINCVEMCNHTEFSKNDEWIDHNINDSDDYESIYNVLVENGGLLLQGNAGNGKTFVAKKIAEKLGNKVKILAPTNKASLNIGGNTIHSFMKMTEDCKINSKLLKLINERYDYIIIDEISMITKHIWKILCILKKETDIKFLLLGDDKQCPPVENEKIDNYFNHSAVKYLTNNNRNILTTMKRYDSKLYEMLKDVDSLDISIFPTNETTRNICYFNTTRKAINKMWNDRLKKENSLFISANADDDYTQDTYIYEELPIIARKTKRNDDDFQFVNSETFTVLSYDNDNIYIYNERPDENGNKECYTTFISVSEFNKYFAMNYCSTTHKAQGETITDNYTIYDWNYMTTKLRYTSLSRAKCIEQVSFKHIKKDKIVCDDFHNNIKK
jgi:nucleoside-triphosphatase THEP1